MSTSPKIRKKSSFGSIREPRWCNASPDANQDGKNRKQVIDIEALRAIRRIVLEIRKRIGAESRRESAVEGCPTGDSGSSETAGANSGQNT
jgi:hypothetical protein